MSITIADFRTRFPQFSADPPFTVDLLDAAIQEAIHRVNADCFRDRYRDGLLYLAAHILTVTAPQGNATASGGSTGQIASVTAGSASVSYQTQASAVGESHASLRETSFGRLFLDLLRLCGPGARVIC